MGSNPTRATKTMKTNNEKDKPLKDWNNPNPVFLQELNKYLECRGWTIWRVSSECYFINLYCAEHVDIAGHILVMNNDSPDNIARALELFRETQIKTISNGKSA